MQSTGIIGLLAFSVATLVVASGHTGCEARCARSADCTERQVCYSGECVDDLDDHLYCQNDDECGDARVGALRKHICLIGRCRLNPETRPLAFAPGRWVEEPPEIPTEKPRDAGTGDAGETPDAGEPDSGAMIPDAEASDTGTSTTADAGAGLDAQIADTGTSTIGDAGTSTTSDGGPADGNDDGL